MRHTVLAQGSDRTLRYEWREGTGWTGLAARTVGAPAARDAVLSGDIAATYGDVFAPALRGSPCSAFVAEGSAISVYRPRRLSLPEHGAGSA